MPVTASMVNSSDNVETQLLAGAHVLVVDDDDDARELFCRALEVAGATVAEAHSAASAFEAFCAERPDVVISDLNMPGEGGCSLIRRIRKHPDGQQVAAIAITGFGDEERDRALADGFQLFLLKPVTPSALRASVVALMSAKTPALSG